MCRTGIAGYSARALSTTSCRSQAECSSGWVEMTIRSGLNSRDRRGQRGQRAVVAERSLGVQPARRADLPGSRPAAPGRPRRWFLPDQRRAGPLGLTGVHRVGRHAHEVLRLPVGVDRPQLVEQLRRADRLVGQHQHPGAAGPVGGVESSPADRSAAPLRSPQYRTSTTAQASRLSTSCDRASSLNAISTSTARIAAIVAMRQHREQPHLDRQLLRDVRRRSTTWETAISR